MINIVITAGGTVENIDAVRKITNTSTGKLASLICREIIKCQEGNDFKIHYVMSTIAEKPEIESDKIQYYPVSNVQSVIDTIEEIFKHHKVHYFIHSMAVSDFTTSYAVQVDRLACEIIDAMTSTTASDKEGQIRKILASPKSRLENNEKISSQNDILIGLKRTPKVISQIKKYDHEVFLVGFKLLNHVSEEHLIKVATHLERENQCNLVLANDSRDIDDKKHKAMLIENGMVINKFHTKDEIARGLIDKMFRKVVEQ